MSFLHSVKELFDRSQARRATLPWDELEAEAARQRCSPADIFFDRAGVGDAGAADEPADDYERHTHCVAQLRIPER